MVPSPRDIFVLDYQSTEYLDHHVPVSPLNNLLAYLSQHAKAVRSTEYWSNAELAFQGSWWHFLLISLLPAIAGELRGQRDWFPEATSV